MPRTPLLPAKLPGRARNRLKIGRGINATVQLNRCKQRIVADYLDRYLWSNAITTLFGILCPNRIALGIKSLPILINGRINCIHVAVDKAFLFSIIFAIKGKEILVAVSISKRAKKLKRAVRCGRQGREPVRILRVQHLNLLPAVNVLVAQLVISGQTALREGLLRILGAPAVKRDATVSDVVPGIGADKRAISSIHGIFLREPLSVVVCSMLFKDALELKAHLDGTELILIGADIPALLGANGFGLSTTIGERTAVVDAKVVGIGAHPSIKQILGVCIACTEIVGTEIARRVALVVDLAEHMLITREGRLAELVDIGVALGIVLGKLREAIGAVLIEQHLPKVHLSVVDGTVFTVVARAQLIILLGRDLELYELAFAITRHRDHLRRAPRIVAGPCGIAPQSIGGRRARNIVAIGIGRTGHVVVEPDLGSLKPRGARMAHRHGAAAVARGDIARIVGNDLVVVGDLVGIAIAGGAGVIYCLLDQAVLHRHAGWMVGRHATAYNIVVGSIVIPGNTKELVFDELQKTVPVDIAYILVVRRTHMPRSRKGQVLTPSRIPAIIAGKVVIHHIVADVDIDVEANVFEHHQTFFGIGLHIVRTVTQHGGVGHDVVARLRALRRVGVGVRIERRASFDFHGPTASRHVGNCIRDGLFLRRAVVRSRHDLGGKLASEYHGRLVFGDRGRCNAYQVAIGLGGIEGLLGKSELRGRLIGQVISVLGERHIGLTAIKRIEHTVFVSILESLRGRAVGVVVIGPKRGERDHAAVRIHRGHRRNRILGGARHSDGNR